MLKAPLICLFVGLSACASAPQPDTAEFDDGTVVFSHGGFDFAAKIDGQRLYVRVPCCQTYDADEAFKSLLLSGVQARIGCKLAEPEFTDGWIGPWQMQAELKCQDASGVLEWTI